MRKEMHKYLKYAFIVTFLMMIGSLITVQAYPNLAGKYEVILSNEKGTSKTKSINIDLSGGVKVSENPSTIYYCTEDVGAKRTFNSIAPSKGTVLTWYGKVNGSYSYRNWTSKGGSTSGSWANNSKKTISLKNVDATATTPHIRLPKVYKEGYTFTGWEVTETQTAYYYFEGGYVKASGASNPGVKKGSDGFYYMNVGAYSTIKTVKPTFKPNNFYVRYHANGGSGYMADQTFTYGVPQNMTPNAFTRTGYSFIGWKVHREYDNK